MRKYFYSNGQEKEGPVTFEELRNLDINPDTLIWHEGMDTWKAAKFIDELQEILELNPPPIEAQAAGVTFEALNNSTVTPPISLKRKQGMFSNAFSFDGRIRRLEYGISIIIYLFLYTIVLALTEEIPIVGLLIIPSIWFLSAQAAKRCHDMGNSGWYQLIPFYMVWIIFAKGDSVGNKYGRDPK